MNRAEELTIENWTSRGAIGYDWKQGDICLDGKQIGEICVAVYDYYQPDRYSPYGKYPDSNVHISLPHIRKQLKTKGGNSWHQGILELVRKVAGEGAADMSEVPFEYGPPRRFAVAIEEWVGGLPERRTASHDWWISLRSGKGEGQIPGFGWAEDAKTFVRLLNEGSNEDIRHWIHHILGNYWAAKSIMAATGKHLF